MKKIISTLLAVTLVFSALALFGCGEKTTKNDLQLKVEAAQNMTEEELIAKAKEETGDFVAYGNTSRITTAMENFIKKYGEQLGVKGSAQKKSDGEIYTLLDNEKAASDKSQNASMVLIQDSATLKQFMSVPDSMLTNYVPKGMEDKVDEVNLLPLAHQFINKLFIYNSVGEEADTAKFTNVWQLTESAYKGKIFFKNPKDEQVNLNFLIMLSSDEWAGKLKDAYVSLYSAEATDVGSGKEYKNYGYKWISEFLSNCNFSISSDTTIASTLSKTENKGKMGLFVLSKIRDASVNGENLQVSAWDKEDDGSVIINPFAGFMYSIYAQLATYGPRPYTAMLFINYLMTEDGFVPWKSLGGYSANKTVPVYEGKLTKPETTVIDDKEVEVLLDNNKAYLYLSGKDGDVKVYTYLTKNDDGTYTVTDQTIKAGTEIDVDGVMTKLSVKNATITVSNIKDSELTFWMRNLVVEDGSYILSVKADIMDWIYSKIG